MGSTPEGKDSTLWPDTPKGPLSAYRARASFSSKELLLFWDGEDVLQFKVRSAGSLVVFLFPDRSDIEVPKPGGFSGPNSSVGWVGLGTVWVCLLLPHVGPQDARRKEWTRFWNSCVLLSTGIDVFMWGILGQTGSQAAMAPRENKDRRARETPPLAFRLAPCPLCYRKPSSRLWRMTLSLTAPVGLICL